MSVLTLEDLQAAKSQTANKLMELDSQINNLEIARLKFNSNIGLLDQLIAVCEERSKLATTPQVTDQE